MKTIFHTVLMSTLILIGCQVGPDEINYGSDMCDYCHMTIVDNQFAAQLVTNKGRTQKFDAIECMIHALDSKDKTDFAHILIPDFSQPGKWVDAVDATYVISPSLPSPMGANLSGFQSREAAAKILQEHEGEMHDWTEITSLFKQNNNVMSH